MKTTQQGGLSLLELTIVVAISSVLILGVFQFITKSIELSVKQSVKINLQGIRRESVSFLSDITAFGVTASQTTFACAKAGTCTGNQAFSILRADGSTFYNGVSATAGFNESGTQCNTYPSVECNIKLNIFYRGLCYSCNPKQIEISGSFASVPNSGTAKYLNLSLYNFKLITDVQ